MKKVLIIWVAFVVVLVYLGFQQNTIENLKRERARYQDNTETLLQDLEQYQTRDALNAAKVGTLELTIKEYEKYRAADAQLIQTLQTRNRDLSAITTAQTKTIMELSAVPHDTVIIRDSVAIPAVAVHAGDAWYDFDGILSDNDFSGTLAVRDSLMLVETVQYKRFWGFLWKTKKERNRQLDILSKCPHTKILNCEHIVIDK